MVEYLQRVFGYAATGSIAAQCYFEFWGGGFNGQSTVIEIVGKVLGNDYTVNPRASLITSKAGESHPTEIANLFGKRMAMVSETDAGKNLNEALIKEMTGKTRLAGRRMHEDFWEFTPTHKLFIDTNHRLAIRNQDDGIWRRPRPIHCKAKLPDSYRTNHTFQEDLLASEGEGILTWLVEGALNWYHTGDLADPLEVTQGVQEQRAENDVIGLFLEEMVEAAEGEWITKKKLHGLYKEWGEESGLNPLGIIQFGKELRGRGYEEGIRCNEKAWLGVKFSPVEKRPSLVHTEAEALVNKYG
jgi:putative DNA primase/helicase